MRWQSSNPPMGYYAHCSFTPISTIIFWAIATVLYSLGKRWGSNLAPLIL